jgi:hypothetical protein
MNHPLIEVKQLVIEIYFNMFFECLFYVQAELQEEVDVVWVGEGQPPAVPVQLTYREMVMELTMMMHMADAYIPMGRVIAQQVDSIIKTCFPPTTGK